MSDPTCMPLASAAATSSAPFFGSVEISVADGGQVGLIDEALCRHGFVAHVGGHSRSEHRAYVDEHVEDRESRVALSGIFGAVIEVADHHLQVAFEEACAGGYEHEKAAQRITSDVVDLISVGMAITAYPTNITAMPVTTHLEKLHLSATHPPTRGMK